MTEEKSFYERNIIKRQEELSFTPSLENEKESSLLKCEEPRLMDLSDLGFENEKNKRGIYYISDIHLDHKIYKKFGDKGDKKSVRKYIKGIAKNLLLDDDGNEIRFPIGDNRTILICGDTSHSFEINKMFYEELSLAIPFRDIFVILGNHELWEFESTDAAINAYEDLFKDMTYIHLLQNSLFISNPHTDELDEINKERAQISADKSLTKQQKEKALEKNYKKCQKMRLKYGTTPEQRHKGIINECIFKKDKLLNMTAEKLREACFDSKEIVFGSIGYTQYNNQFNSNNGIYRRAIKTRDQESRLAKEVELIYKKLTDALPQNRLIIATHMPLSDWCSSPMQEQWTYFSGHTHKNIKTLDENGHLYADNQVGYYGKRIKFNSAITENRLDYFAYYPDGIYDITPAEYHKYYMGISKTLSGVDMRGSDNPIIKMIKKSGMYLFALDAGEKLYLLEGGRRRKLNIQDINYYYDNLLLLSNAISEAVDGIREYLQQISHFVKQIGGSGRIHGNIVDIDFFDHLMIDIHDGSIMPYFAYSVADRYEYPNVEGLLEDNRPDLYKKFLETKNNFPILRNNGQLSKTVVHSTNGKIYKDSNMMLKIQDMLDYDVVRFWNDEIIEMLTAQSEGEKRLLG